MRIRFIVLSLCLSVLMLGCGWQIPEKVSLKSKAEYNFATGEIDTKLSDTINFDELIKPEENSGFTVYNYLPDGKSRQFVMKMAIADIPIDLESSFNESSINEAVKGLSFEQEIKVPSISFSTQTEIPLGGVTFVPVESYTDVHLSELSFTFSLNDTNSDIFDSCEVKEGNLFTEIVIPSDWSGVSVSYDFKTTGGLVVSAGKESNVKKTISLKGKTITKDTINATANITLTVQPGYKVSSSPLMLKISSDIKTLETLNVNLSDVKTSFYKSEPLPDGMKKTFKSIVLNKSGLKIDYINTLPQGNDIELTVKSVFFGLSGTGKTGNLETTAGTEKTLELMSDKETEITIDSSAYDFDVKIKLPGTTEPNKVSLKNVKFGEKYKLSMNITPVLDWKTIVLKSDFANSLTQEGKKKLPFNINELLSSVSKEISDYNLFANIQIKSLPIYAFFTKPTQSDGSKLFSSLSLTGKMSVYYGDDSGSDNNKTACAWLVDKDSTDEKIPRDIGFVEYPKINLSEDKKKMVTCLDKVSFSIKGDVAEVVNAAMKDTGTGNALYVDYNLQFSNGSSDGSSGELEISKNELATKGNIGVYIFVVLPLEFSVNGEVNVNAEKLLSNTIDGDIFGRTSNDSFKDVEKYFDLINSASISYEFTKLPICSENSDSITFELGVDCGDPVTNKIALIENSSIRKGTLSITKEKVEQMLNNYPAKPTMRISIADSAEFYIPQEFDVAVKLNLKINTDGEIEIFGGQK